MIIPGGPLSWEVGVRSCWDLGREWNLSCLLTLRRPLVGVGDGLRGLFFCEAEGVEVGARRPQQTGPEVDVRHPTLIVNGVALAVVDLDQLRGLPGAVTLLHSETGFHRCLNDALVTPEGSGQCDICHFAVGIDLVASTAVDCRGGLGFASFVGIGVLIIGSPLTLSRRLG